MQRGAKVSECGRYRYALTRSWDAGAREALFVMLNPSIADGTRDDPTVRRPLNVEHVRALADGTCRVVLAWGAHAKHYPEQVDRVLGALSSGPLCCLGRTDDGHPRHPLMLPYSAVLLPFDRGTA
jgi:hypothetical protein